MKFFLLHLKTNKVFEGYSLFKLLKPEVFRRVALSDKPLRSRGDFFLVPLRKQERKGEVRAGIVTTCLFKGIYKFLENISF